jgi:hypothetical protein
VTNRLIYRSNNPSRSSWYLTSKLPIRRRLLPDEAKSIARYLGLTLRQVRSGNYRVNFRDGNETTAYYTDKFEDAVNAVVAMARKRAFSSDCRADEPETVATHRVMTTLAATNKCLAQSNKSRTACEATKKRASSVSLQEKTDDKRRASGRSDLPSDDVGLHRRRGGLRRDRVTP